MTYIQTLSILPSKKFSSTLMGSLTSKNAILKEVRDCVITDNEDRCRQISPYIHSFWKDLHVKNGCVRVNDRIPNSKKDVEAIHATHPGIWVMTDMAVYAWLPFTLRDILSKTAKCDPCVKIGKNVKSIILSNKWAPINCVKYQTKKFKLISVDQSIMKKIKNFIFWHV